MKFSQVRIAVLRLFQSPPIVPPAFAATEKVREANMAYQRECHIESRLRAIAALGQLQDAPPLQTALPQIEMDSPQRNPEGFP